MRLPCKLSVQIAPSPTPQCFITAGSQGGRIAAHVLNPPSTRPGRPGSLLPGGDLSGSGGRQEEDQEPSRLLYRRGQVGFPGGLHLRLCLVGRGGGGGGGGRRGLPERAFRGMALVCRWRRPDRLLHLRPHLQASSGVQSGRGLRDALRAGGGHLHCLHGERSESVSHRHLRSGGGQDHCRTDGMVGGNYPAGGLSGGGPLRGIGRPDVLAADRSVPGPLGADGLLFPVVALPLDGGGRVSRPGECGSGTLVSLLGGNSTDLRAGLDPGRTGGGSHTRAVQLHGGGQR